MSPSPVPAPTSRIVASLLGDGHEVQVRLSGWSMKPLFRSGTTLRFSRKRAPRVGDIALVGHDNGALVAHRIVGLGKDWVQTKGDSCLAPDARLPLSSVIGCAVSLPGLVSVPLGNRLARALGLATNRAYPWLVRAYRTILPRRDLRGC